MNWTKLFNTIITSSVWQADDTTRLVWITMLATKDSNGIVEASIVGLAHIARVSMEDCEKAIHILESPDPYSRTKTKDGRRIEKVPGGWKVINHVMYREKGRSVGRREYLRQKQAERRVRQKQQCQPMSTNVNQNKPISDTDTDTDTDTTPPISPQGVKGEKSPKSGSQNSEAVQKVFDHWNQYAGQAVEKPGQGGVKRVVWKSHRKLSQEKVRAIRQALKDFSAEELRGAITNYAAVLLGREYFWSYPWTLNEFLTRGRERHKQAERQFWQFLPDNFDETRYRRQGAKVPWNDPTEEEADEILDKCSMTAEQINKERAKMGWRQLAEAEFAELQQAEDGGYLITREVRDRWTEISEKEKAIA